MVWVLCVLGVRTSTAGGFFTGYWLTTGKPDNPADTNHSVPYGKLLTEQRHLRRWLVQHQ